MTTVAIVEDDGLLRKSLETLVGEASDCRCVCACSSAEEALQKIPKWNPEVAVIDIHLPKMSGIECTQRLKDLCPKIGVLILTVYDDGEKIFDALRAGASGYLLKRTVASEILDAIRDIKTGGAPMSSQVARKVVASFRQPTSTNSENTTLSVREQEILSQLSKGFSNKEIADRMCISLSTVRTHLRHIYEKLHVRGRVEAAMHFLNDK